MTPREIAESLPALFNFARSTAGLEYWAEVCRRLEAEQGKLDALAPVTVGVFEVDVSNTSVLLTDHGRYTGTHALTTNEATKLGQALIAKAGVINAAVAEKADKLEEPISWFAQTKIVPASPGPLGLISRFDFEPDREFVALMRNF